jgi:glutamine synthetase type III
LLHSNKKILSYGQKDILKVNEGRGKIEEYFRIMETDFEARPTLVLPGDYIEKNPQYLKGNGFCGCGRAGIYAFL